MPQLQRSPNERELEQLRKLFLKAETEIINEIGRLRSLGLIDYHAVAALERVQAILQKLQDDCWVYVPRMIEKQFYVRVPEARKILEPVKKRLLGYRSAVTLTAEQTDIVQRLTMNLMGQLSEAAATVTQGLESALLGRPKPDVLRQTALQTAAEMEAAGHGVRRAVPELVNTLHQQGVTAFVDKAGRNWSLHTYGNMVCRSTSRQAEVLATLTADPEHDLYQISSHGTTCKLCAPFEGRVYSKSGRDPDFPPLAMAFGKVDPNGPDELSNTWLNIHPNCLHAVLPWTSAGRTPEELQAIKDFSNPEKNPFTRDPRTQKQVEAYRNKERAREKWLADYRQFEKYRLTIPNATPKSFDTFLKNKMANSEQYRLMKLDYQRQTELLRHPEKALPGGESASAAAEKFTKYFFNPQNKRGMDKGRAFSSRLGYDANNWELLQKEILSAATKYPAVNRGASEYGIAYSQNVILYGLKKKPANVQIGWIVHPDGTAHFVTAHMEGI